MNGRIYVLNQRREETFDAAGKAMQDVFSVLADRGANVIWSMPKSSKKFLKALDLPYLFFFLLFRAGKRDFVFYSIPESRIKIRLLAKVKRVKGFQMICFINDLNAFRYGYRAGETLSAEAQAELSDINAAEHVLVPNAGSEEMLRAAGCHSHMVTVGVWDYRMSDAQAAQIEQRSQTGRPAGRRGTGAESGGVCGKAEGGEAGGTFHIAFAGNLNKSEFLAAMEIPAGVRFDLWGRLDEERRKMLPDACDYHGLLSSEEVPLAVCTADFGLVWDGTGRDEIEGGLGEYLRYNNSHKCALYLAAGIPVIVWSHAGMAHFVREHQCGILIERLSELSGAIRQADYGRLKAAAEEVAPRLRRGYYLNRALDAIVEES